MRRHNSAGQLRLEAGISGRASLSKTGPFRTPATSETAQTPEQDGADAASYEALAELREEFHRTGRFDDANAKLDEIVKLLAVKLFEDRRPARTSRFSVDYLRKVAATEFGEPGRLALALRKLCEEVLSEPEFRNPDGTSIFGSTPTLNLQPTEDDFAAKIVGFINSLPIPTGHASSIEPSQLPDADILNKAFNHFVRDTFRNTKEDAQYMTPPEVVSAIADLVCTDIEAEGDLQRIFDVDTRAPYLILDPACGTGSFLVAMTRRLLQRAHELGIPPKRRAEIATKLTNRCVYGQDKVDRMVRLASLNLMLFGAGRATVWQGNTVLDGSQLESLTGRVDLILTNPPFGARYDAVELLRSRGSSARFPMLSETLRDRRLASRITSSAVSSEVAILDRCFSLLRPGGRLAIILPDSVVSSGGINESVRRWVKARSQLKAVIELPSVTFALGGTRTKTVVVYLKKVHDSDRAPQGPGPSVFTAVCEDIGYRVIERQGATVRLPSAVNELPNIIAAYGSSRGHLVGNHDYVAASHSPSCVWVRQDCLINDKWTPKFYHADRLAAVHALRALEGRGFALVRLTDLASIGPAQRPRVRSAALHYVSVLHVAEDGSIDLREASRYRPKTPGKVCHAGDVLLSKINPRIPRVCVVPETASPLECSAEFAVLKPKGIDPHVLAALLMHPLVRAQVESLTSGTSSSHSRVKDSELGEILLPIAAEDVTRRRWAQIATRLRQAVAEKYKIDGTLWLLYDELAASLQASDAPKHSG